METKVEALEENSVKLTITVDADEIDKRIKKTYRDFAQRYNFPGFRRGKAPRPVIDSALGSDTVHAAVTEEVINDSYPAAVEESLIHPMGNPQFGDEYLVKDHEPFTFTVTVSVKPNYELTSYDPVEIELPPERATEEEITEQIDQLRDYYYTYKDANANTKVAKDGYVELKMSATDAEGEALGALASESRLYNLGSGLFPESFDKELIGMKKGESKSFTINLADGSSTMTASFVGKTESIAFDVEVLSIKKKILPELTDEWVKEIFGFETVDELREQVTSSIEVQKAGVIPNLKEQLCLSQLGERLIGEVPKEAIESHEADLLKTFFQQLQQQGLTLDVYLMQNNLTADQFKADVKQQASDMARDDLALDAWAAHAGLVATPEDVTAEFEKSGHSDPAALEEEWRKGGQLYLVREGILRRRALEQVLESAVVTETTQSSSSDEKDDKKKSKATSAAKAEKDEKKTAKKSTSKKTSAKKSEDAAAEDKAADDKSADKAAPAKKSTAKKSTAKKKADDETEAADEKKPAKKSTSKKTTSSKAKAAEEAPSDVEGEAAEKAGE